MSRKARAGLEYRRVREEDDDLEERIKDTPASPCLLPCLLLLLILLSLSLALLFFLTAPKPPHGGVFWHQDKHNNNHSSPEVTKKNSSVLSSTTTTTTTKPVTTESTEKMHGNGSSSSEEVEATPQLNLNDTVSQLQLEKERLVQTIRQLTQYLEKVTGVEGELLVPLTMLILFLTAVAMVSCCCCLISRRRERRRRELFGKIITDLQTGDSKRVLLNHSDMDD